MGYAAKQSMIDRFGEPELIQATNLGLTQTGAIVDDVLTRALSFADSLIDSYLAARYELPLTTVPTVLVDFACDIARFRLWKTSVSDVVKDRYDRAIAFLKAIAKGETNLAVNPTTASPSPEGGVSVTGSDRVFTRSGLGDYNGG